MAARGYSIYRNLDVGATGAVVAAGQHVIGGWYLSNANAAAVFVKLYDKATAPSNSDTPVLTIRVPAGSSANLLIPQNSVGGDGIAFQQGIGLRATTGVADNDNTGPSTNDVICNVFYQ